MKKKVLFLVNHDIVIYNFRLELVERLIEEGYEVIISSPYGERIDDLVVLGCKFREISISRHGINPFTDLGLLIRYKMLMLDEKPDIVFSYTVKPNIYGGMASAAAKVPYIANITGLGTAVEKEGVLQKIVLLLYRYAFRKVQRVFCQNEEILAFFKKNHLAVSKLALIPGSGVNLERFVVLPYPTGETIEFAFISRIMKEKGIDEFLNAAKQIKARYPNTVFHVCGFCEQEYQKILEDLTHNGTIVYQGMLRDIRKMLLRAHCIVLPSYHEGMANVLLESAATGRPVIATRIFGCIETFEDGISGFDCEPRNTDSLVQAVSRFLELSYEQKREMGLAGRKRMECKFSREVIIDAYVNEMRIVKEEQNNK